VLTPVNVNYVLRLRDWSTMQLSGVKRSDEPRYCICDSWRVCACGNQPPYHCEICCLLLDPDQVLTAQLRGDLPPDDVVCEAD